MHFDRALGEMVIERVDSRSFAQEILRILAGTVDGVDESNFRFASLECFLDEIDIFLCGCRRSEFRTSRV